MMNAYTLHLLADAINQSINNRLMARQLPGVESRN